MKKILLLAVCMFIGAYLNAQTLDYGNYYKSFYDEFDYPSLTSGNSSSGTTSGTPFSSNWLITVGWPAAHSGSNTITEASQVSLHNSGGVSFISLTENIKVDSFLDNPSDPNDTNSNGTPKYVSRNSGMIQMKPSNIQNLFGYGILEAMMRFPGGGSGAGSISSYEAAAPSFWTGGGNSTEIDIFDDGLFSDWLPLRVWDWYYTENDPTHFSGPYEVTYTAQSPPIPTTYDLTDWHIYSAKWTPTDVTYYIDGNYLADIPYSLIRTYPEMNNGLELILWANNVTIDGQHLDIDWVKVWKQNCSSDMINISDSTTGLIFSVINPGLYKHQIITSSSSFMTSTDLSTVVILEAEQTTIQTNFIADESTLYTGTYTLPSSYSSSYQQSSSTYGPINTNGFFEILPINCINDPSGSGFRTASSGTSNNTDDIYANAVKNNKIFSSNDTSGINSGITNATGYTQIQVYPNPTQNNITISYPCTSDGQLEISIQDVDGRTIYTESVVCGAGNNVQHSIDISSFAQGVYFISLTLNDQHVVRKIVKI